MKQREDAAGHAMAGAACKPAHEEAAGGTLQGEGAAVITVAAGTPLLCLQPVYMRSFVCDGSRCGSLCCCAKWGVALDAATLARYEEKPALLRELKRGLERSEATGGWVMRHEDERCVFLREDGLCSLQRRFGIGAISDVCAEYPRKMHKVGETLDRALCLSCPVAAAEVLFSAAPLAFEWVELAASRPAYVDALPLGAPLSAAAFRALQLACLALLQAENLALDARLAALGLLLARAEAYVDEGAAEALTKDAAAIAEAAAGEAQALLAANPFDAAGYLTFFLHLFPALAQATADDLPETVAYMAKIRAAFGEAAERDGTVQLSKEALASFAARRRRYRERMLAPHGRALENWLVNEFVLGRYPLMGGTSFLANYEVFVVLYKLLEFLLLAGNTPAEAEANAALQASAACTADGEAEQTRQSLLAAVAWLAVRTNHFYGYIDALAEEIARLLPGERLVSLLDGASA